MCCHAFDFPVPRRSLVKMCRGVFIGLRELQAGTDDGRGRRGQGGRGHASVQLLLRDLLRRQPGTNCIKIGLPGKLILSKRKGLWEVLFS